jgi:PAT family beta-lactamase induction signal transducer AmpG
VQIAENAPEADAVAASSANPAWLFGILSTPYGFSNAVITILMPYVLRRNGVAVDRIAEIVALAILPTIWCFVYSPLVDLGLSRKTWLLGSCALVAACSGLAVLLISKSLAVVTALLFLSTAFAGLISTSCGTLLTTLPASERGTAGGWYNAGNLGAGALGASVTIWLADRVSAPWLATFVVAFSFLPMLGALAIREEQRSSPGLGVLLGNMFRDVREMARSPRTLTGLLFFLSPVGSAAVMNLISGVGPDFHASNAEVMWITGAAGGLLCALGCLIGGYVCSRLDRRVGYSLAGALGAAFALYLGFAKPTAWTYGAGYTGYAIAAGFAYAVFTALVLDVIGKRKHAAGTAYAVLVASGNLPISYMTWLDGAGYHRWGVRGLMGADAAANAGGAVVLLLVAVYSRRYWKRET